MSFNPSPYQQAIFDFVANGTGHGIVNAVAGSGKTTTNIEALKYVPPFTSVVFLAFNKHIAEELKQRGVDCASTFHSLGNANIKKAMPKAKFEQHKSFYLLDKIECTLSEEDKGAIVKLVSLLKANMLEATNENIDALSDAFDIDFNGSEATIFRCVKQLFKDSLSKDDTYDFDDMIYWPAIGKVSCKKFDFLFVDETQDLNKAQIEFAVNSMEQGGRMLLIGDPFQSIYAFRGAYNGIMGYMQERLQATVLPLSVSYRAPLAIVKLVNENFPAISFEPCDNAKEGYVNWLEEYDLIDVVDNGDVVLCRTNAPLVKPAFQLLREGRKAVILGKDIASGLITLINKRAKLVHVQNANNQLSELIDQLYIYLDNEREKLTKAKKLTRLATLTDQVETIVAISDGCRTIAELKAKTESIFSNSQSGVVFSSVHKAKGLEWNTVFILRPEQMPHPMAKDPAQIQQEENIRYVAYTRTRDNLYLVKTQK